jgi:HEAT repeat protein
MSSNRKSKRDQIIQLLLARDFSALSDLTANTRGVVTILLQMLFDPDSLLHWRATEAIGHLAKTHPKRIKEIIPRLLWSLNEDSASFGWGAAAVLGEIGKNNYKIVEDIILMLFNYLEEDFTREGMLWGLGRLGQTQPQLVLEAAPRLQACLADPNPQVRTYAAWSLGIIGAQAAIPDLRRLTNDPEPVKLYEDETVRETTVGQVAREALQRLESSSPRSVN